MQEGDAEGLALRVAKENRSLACVGPEREGERERIGIERERENRERRDPERERENGERERKSDDTSVKKQTKTPA